MRKGQFISTSELLMMIPRIFIVLIIVILVLAIVGMVVDRKIDSVNVEGYLLNYRLTNSKECFVYEEEGKFYPGIIDLDKFNQETVEKCAAYKGNKGYRLALENMEGKQFSEEIIFNEKFATLYPLCSFEEKNFDCYAQTKYVLVEDNGKIIPGYMNISMVTQYV